MKSIAAIIKRGSFAADIRKTLFILDWKPISLEKTLIDMCISLREISINWLNKNVTTDVCVYLQIKNFTTINLNLTIVIK